MRFLFPQTPKHQILFLTWDYRSYLVFAAFLLFMLTAAPGNSPLEPFLTARICTSFASTQVIINLCPAFQHNACPLLSIILLPTTHILKSSSKFSLANLRFLRVWKSPYRPWSYSKDFIQQHGLFDLCVYCALGKEMQLREENGENSGCCLSQAQIPAPSLKSRLDPSAVSSYL